MNESIKGNIASETKISIYEGEWPDTRAIPESDIPLPVELFVAAPMIKDWREGRVSESKGGKSSRDIIRQYAGMNPKTSPPIAKMRGDREILCRGISIVRLN